MWKSSDSNAPQGSTPSLAEFPATPSAPQNHAYSMIGKSIVIKGEITASDPLYVNGCVEGSIDAPAQRVTVGKGGKVKADISAREVIVMGDVCGNVDGGYRVEIRNEGSFTGDLIAQRICIEDGAVLKGAIDVSKPGEEKKTETPVELLEDAPAVESGLDAETEESFAELEKVS